MALGLWRNYYRTDWTQRFGARAPPPPPPAHAVASVTVMPTAGYDGKPVSSAPAHNVASADAQS